MTRRRVVLLPSATRGRLLSKGFKDILVKVLLPVISCMLRLLDMTHSVDATKLQRRVGDEHSQELPAHTPVLDQLQHRVVANALLGGLLLQHLLHLRAAVLVAPQLPQSCEGGER